MKSKGMLKQIITNIPDVFNQVERYQTGVISFFRSWLKIYMITLRLGYFRPLATSQVH